MRGKGQGSGGYTVTFKNINVEDPRPTLQPFKILMEGKYYVEGESQNLLLINHHFTILSSHFFGIYNIYIFLKTEIEMAILRC